MRSAPVAFAATLLVGLLALAAVGVTQRSTLVYSTGVNPVSAIADIGSGQRACQGPMRPHEGASFDRVAFRLGTYGRPGSAVSVVVRDDETGMRLASGELAGGYGDVDEVPVHVVYVGRVATNTPLRVCIENEGPRKLAVFGQIGIASPSTVGSIDGTPVAVDFGLSLHREERSLLALLPEMAERASRFRAGWVTPAVYAALALALVLGAPLLLFRGLRRAEREDAARAAAAATARRDA